MVTWSAGALPWWLVDGVAVWRRAAAPGREHGDGLVGATCPRDAEHVATLRMPLIAKREICSARFVVSPTAVPSQVIPGSTDARVLGVHFNAFAFEP